MQSVHLLLNELPNEIIKITTMGLSIVLLLMVIAFLFYKMLKDLAYIWMYTLIIRTADKDAEAKRNNPILLKVLKRID